MGPADSDVPLARPVDLEGVKVTYFPSRRLRRLYWSPPMRRALAASVGGFDVVHLHAVYLWPIWAGARAARAQGVPYVISPRGMLVPELMRRKSRWAKAAWIALVERTNLEAAAAIHATSSVEAGHLAGFGWKLPPIATIPHGVDDPPPPSAAPLSADIAAATAQGPLVLAFGRISWEKGLDRLIAALPQAPAARLVLAGDDADGYAASLAAQARAGGVDGRVTIVARHVEGADKEALFGAARMFAMTSLSENFGIAAFEAMRRGVPVLTTPDVGMSEIVRESGAGRIVDAAPASIAAGINAMLDDPAGSRAMGEAGRAHVVAHYGWPSVARRMADLYGSVAKRQERDGAQAMMDLLAHSPFDLATERRVVIIADWLPPDFGAVGQYMHLRAQALAEQGHDVTLIGLASGGGSVRSEARGKGTLTEVRLAARPVPRGSLLSRLMWTLWTDLRLVMAGFRDAARRRRRAVHRLAAVHDPSSGAAEVPVARSPGLPHHRLSSRMPDRRAAASVACARPVAGAHQLLAPADRRLRGAGHRPEASSRRDRRAAGTDRPGARRLAGLVHRQRSRRTLAGGTGGVLRAALRRQLRRGARGRYGRRRVCPPSS